MNKNDTSYLIQIEIKGIDVFLSIIKGSGENRNIKTPPFN